MLEWVAGRNITPRQTRPSQPRGVLKLQVYTDDAAETDTLAVTYPRSGSSSREMPLRSASKQVKFTDATQQALVKRDPVEQRLDSDLEVETSGSEDSVEYIKVITRKKRGKTPVTPPQEPICLKELPEISQASDDVEDIIPHPSCPCAKCVYGRKLLRKARRKRKAKAETEGETTAVESPAPASAPPANSGNQGDEYTNTTGEPAPIVTDEAQNDGNNRNAKESAPDKASSTNAAPVALSSSPSRSKKQRLPKAYPPPDLRTPHLIMPPRAEVLQIEHAVETPEDPRPNAFVDNEHGICRVYHGPAYGNPYGSLYPRRGLSGPPPFQPLPVGVPHPMHNPYYNGFDPNQMARYGQPTPPGWPPGTGYVPPPPPMGYPPGHQPEMAYPVHMPWPNYQVPAEGRKEHRGHKEHKKVPSPVVPSVAPQVAPAFMPAATPAAKPSASPPAVFSVEKPSEAAPADVTEPQKSNDRPHVSPPFGLLTPRTIAAKFSDHPVSNPSSKGKDKDKGWDNNVGPKSPSHKSGSKGGGGWGGGSNGWGGGPSHASNNNNAWGFGPRPNSSPRASNNDIAGGSGWGGGGGNNDGGNGGWGAGSQQSGSKKSSNHSRNSANQPAATIGGDGWGGGWDTASMENQINTNGNAWGGSSPRRSNNGGHHAFNTSPRVSDRDNNNNNNVNWGPSGSNHSSARGSNKGWGTGSGSGGGGDGKNRRHSNSPPSRGRHASGGSGNRHSPPQNGGWGGGGGHHQHRSPSRMPGSWETVPSNNAGPQGTPGGRSRGHSSPRQRDGSNGSRPQADTWGGFGGSGAGGAGGGPAWGDPTAAQSTKVGPMW